MTEQRNKDDIKRHDRNVWRGKAGDRSPEAAAILAGGTSREHPGAAGRGISPDLFRSESVDQAKVGRRPYIVVHFAYCDAVEAPYPTKGVFLAFIDLAKSCLVN